MRSLLMAWSMVIMILISGCAGSMTDAELTAIGAGLGADLDQNGNILFFAEFDQPVRLQESATSKPGTAIITGSGQTPTQAARDITLTLPRLPLWSHADVFIVGENLARTDMGYLADFLAHNRNIRNNALMFLAKDVSVYEVMAAKCPLTFGSTRDLTQLIHLQEHTLGSYVGVSSSEFLTKSLLPGIDPAIPQVKLENTSSKPLTIDGMAVFQKNRMVGSLNARESQGYRWLNSRHKYGGVLILEKPVPGVNSISLDVTRLENQTRPQITEDKIHIRMNIQVMLAILEQDGEAQIIDLAHLPQLQNLAAQEIKGQVAACVHKAQQLNSDILGWGRTVYRYEPSYWAKLEPVWYEVYPEVEWDIKVEAKVRGRYLSTQPLQVR